jgi:translation initiation factor IF-1
MGDFVYFQGQMSKEDLAKFDGVIISTPGGGHYNVQLTNGKTIVAKLSGKMKQNKIRCIVGDQVTVGVSAYDLSHGIILFRKNKKQGMAGPGGAPFSAPSN